jgi:hypothetical protein
MFGWKIGATVFRCSVPICHVSRKVSMISHVLVQVARAVVTRRLELVRGELGSEAVEQIVRIEVRSRCRPHPDQTVLFHRREWDETVIPRRQVRKTVRRSDVLEPPFEVVRPGMIGADEEFLARSAAARDSRTAVTTDVQEGFGGPRLGPNHKDRNPAQVVGHVVARIADLAA